MTSRIDPEQFLRERVAPRVGRRIQDLRSEVSRLEAEVRDRVAAEGTIGLLLDGEGGGAWYVNVAGGRATVSTEPAGTPIIRILQSRADWEALAREAGDESSAGAAFDLTAARVKRLRALEGAVEFRLADADAERRMVLHFGPAEPAPPRCTIRMSADCARRIQRGELTPQGAFMQGLVKLEGDVAFAMQVGATALAR